MYFANKYVCTCVFYFQFFTVISMFLISFAIRLLIFILVVKCLFIVKRRADFESHDKAKTILDEYHRLKIDPCGASA